MRKYFLLLSPLRNRSFRDHDDAVYRCEMTVPFAAFLLIVVLLIAAIVAMGAFIWAVRTNQFSNLNKAAYVIFDDDEPVGVFTDEVFADSRDEEGEGAAQ